jgi:hypothetical protein
MANYDRVAVHFELGVVVDLLALTPSWLAVEVPAPIPDLED